MLIDVQTTGGLKKVRVCDYCQSACIPSGRFCSGRCARNYEEGHKYSATMPRINDANGDPVDHGKTWYWARNRTGQIVGVGKFAWLIGQNTATFFINGTGYSIESFKYIPVQPPVFPDTCEHGVNDGQWCEECNREYKEAMTINEPAE